MDPGARHASLKEIAALHLHFVAVNSVPSELLDEHERDIAKRVIGTDLAFVLPNLRAARAAAANSILARVHRTQILAARSALDELSKTWWIAKRVDLDADQIARAETMLGMPVPIFVRAASALLAFAYMSDAPGAVFMERDLDAEFLAKYEVGQEDLRLAAYKLSTTRDDVQRWLVEIRARFREGIKHLVPSPLLTTPLLRLDLGSGPPYACPSVNHFVAAVRDRVREAISQRGRTDADSADLYGERLVDYLKAFATAASLNVLDLDTIEDRTLRRADLLFFEGDSVLIAEVKRSLATGALSRHLLYPEGIIAVFSHLHGAYGQCQATFARRSWRATGISDTHAAAVVLVDEPVGAEGAVFSDLYGAQTVVDLPFEIMGVDEFENAIGVLGTRRLVELICKKWNEGLRDIPLLVYARNVLGIETQIVEGKRTHLEAEERELFFEAGLVPRNFPAVWP